MKDKVRHIYKDRKLKVMLGRKELPLDKLIDPAVIVLSADELPTLRFELLVDKIDIDELEAIASYTTVDKLREEEENTIYGDGYNGLR